MNAFVVLGSLGFALALTPLAQASDSVVIAHCLFNTNNSADPFDCDVSVSICLDSKACGCGPELIVRCKSQEGFSGVWRPEYQESPETYIVQAVDTVGEDIALRLFISGTSGANGNPSQLQIHGNTILGSCSMAFGTVATFLNPGGCR